MMPRIHYQRLLAYLPASCIRLPPVNAARKDVPACDTFGMLHSGNSNNVDPLSDVVPEFPIAVWSELMPRYVEASAATSLPQVGSMTIKSNAVKQTTLDDCGPYHPSVMPGSGTRGPSAMKMQITKSIDCSHTTLQTSLPRVRQEGKRLLKSDVGLFAFAESRD